MQKYLIFSIIIISTLNINYISQAESEKYKSIRKTTESINQTDPNKFKIENEVIIFDLWEYFNKAGINDTKQRVDEVYLLTALQGIVNRKEPRLFIIASLALFDIEKRFAYNPNYKDIPVTDLDKFWLNEIENKGYIKKSKKIDNLKELLTYFKDKINGIVLWEMKVPATANAALMAAGCENLLPVSRDLGNSRLRKWMLENFPDFKTRLDLTGIFNKADFINLPDGEKINSTGSPKNDVYRFALDRYMKTGKCNPFYMWYNCDAVMWGDLRNMYAGSVYGYLGDRNELQQNGMYNADYWVAKKAFILDLLPWGDTTPKDEPDQPEGADRATWDLVLNESYKLRNGEFGLVGGFPAWWIKYTDVVGDKHEAVPTEWEFITLITSYNMVNEGDAAFGISNSSFYMHLPQMTKSELMIKKTKETEYKNDTTYIAFCMLDYDGSAWVNQMVPSVYVDDQRGKLPLNWCINPIIHQRIPHALRYLYENKTDLDFFGFSDDGAGYLNPTGLTNRKGFVKEDGIQAYEKFAKTLHNRYEIDHTAFYIAYKFDSPWINMAARIDKGYGFGAPINQQLVDGVPVSFVKTHHVAQKQFLETELRDVFKRSIGRKGYSPEFKAFRCILITPSMIVEIIEKLQKEYPEAQVEIVDLRSYYNMLAKKLSGKLISPYMRDESVSAEPDSYTGLTAVQSSGAHYQIHEINGSRSWVLKQEQHGLYLCIDVDDAFAQEKTGNPMELTIEYLDDTNGDILLQYDSTDKSLPFDGAYKESPDTIKLANSGEWRTAIFKIPEAKFFNRQNDGTDLRLCKIQNDTLIIRKAILKTSEKLYK